MLIKIVTTIKLSQLTFKKIDDEYTTLGGNVNQTSNERIISIMILNLISYCLVL